MLQYMSIKYKLVSLYKLAKNVKRSVLVLILTLKFLMSVETDVHK